MSEKASIRSYRDLLVWQKGLELAEQIYRLTKAFPDEERFGLVAQMRRAVVSVPSNIAEGQARHGRKEFIHALSLAQGSLAELDTQLELSGKLGYCSDPSRAEAFKVIAELQKMLSALRQRLSERLAADTPPLATKH